MYRTYMRTSLTAVNDQFHGYDLGQKVYDRLHLTWVMLIYYIIKQLSSMLCARGATYT